MLASIWLCGIQSSREGQYGTMLQLPDGISILLHDSCASEMLPASGMAEWM